MGYEFLVEYTPNGPERGIPRETVFQSLESRTLTMSYV